MAESERHVAQSFIEAMQKESDRGAALFAASILDLYLGELIQAFLVDSSKSRALFKGATSPLSSFNNRISMAYALGLINEDESHDYHVIRDIRNKFGHRIDITSFEDGDISHLLSTIKSAVFKFDGRANAKRLEFDTAITLLIVRVHDRKAEVEKQRRTKGQWTSLEDLEYQITPTDGD
jgi:DNA-binding MltR family transcriptional regulator